MRNYSHGAKIKIAFENTVSSNQNFREIIGKVKTAFSLKSTQLGILLSLFVSLSHFLIPLLPLLFLRELDWSQERFNATKGGLVLIITMFGYLAGGYLGKKFGGKSVIIYSTTIGALVTAFWGLTESWWGSEFYLVFIWSLAEFMMAIVSIQHLFAYDANNMERGWWYTIYRLHGYDESFSDYWVSNCSTTIRAI